MKKILLAMISFYRHGISPYLGSNCRFHPTCSHYTQQAVQKKGALAGISLGFKRLLKCHPFHPGGVDPVE